MSTRDINILFRNNTGNKEKVSLIEGFIVRTKTFEAIFHDLSKPWTNQKKINHLIIGQRGSGKTTLMYRLKYAIEDSDQLGGNIIPVMFSEEQYNITELENLWEGVADSLDELADFKGIKNKLESNVNDSSYEQKAISIIEQSLKSAGKKIIIFLENIDVFFKKIGVDGQKRFLEALVSSKHIGIIASATTYFESVQDNSKPFYDFFKITGLHGLSRKECIDLLLKIGDQFGKREKIESIVATNPKRIESLRRLTGGIPRTISYLFQIFLDNENGKALKDLYQLIDTLTFLYKAELDQLSTQQQKVIDAIARNWDAISVKELVVKTKYESKQISSILNTLEKNQLIEVIPTRTKNNLYRIRERFLNIWYLMRFGKKQEKENIVWLVRFYDAWCDQTELAQHINTHIKNLTDGNYDIAAAIDMGNMFLACENVSSELKYNLYKTTKAILPRNFIKELKISDKLLYNRINSLVKAKQIEQAVEVLNVIESRDEKYYTFTSWFYFRIKEFEKSESAAIHLYQLSPTGRTAFRIAYLNEFHLLNVPKAIEYYNIALEKKEFPAASRLGDIYFQQDDLEKALRFHEMAIENGVHRSLISLAHIFFIEEDFSTAEEYSRKAIEKGLTEAYSNLGLIYQRKSQFKKAQDLFKEALSNGYKPALIHLGILNIVRRKPNYQASVEYFQEAIKNGIKDGYYFLGKLYLHELNDEENGIKNLEISIENGNANAAHVLGHHFQHKGKHVESDEYFLKSFKLGRISALLCLTSAIFAEKRKDKKQYSLDLIEANNQLLKKHIPYSQIEYAFVLLWNDKLDESVSVFLNESENLSKLLKNYHDERVSGILSSIVEYLNLLIAKGHYNITLSLFENNNGLELKQIAKPVYYALMNYMKKEFPKEYLKAGEELKETIDEIIVVIEKYKKDYL